MNKKVIGFLLAVPALMGLGLTSCSDESAIAVKETAQEKLVNVTLTAQISDQTRASFDPDKNILKFKWALDDEIQVVNAANGKYVGKLTVDEVKSDPRVCSFKGGLSIPTGKVKLNFYYLGTKGKASFAGDLTLNDYTVDFSSQLGAANFADNDILMATREFQDAQDGNLGMVNFDRDFAYGRFILKYNDQELNLNGNSVTISANSGKLYNKATLNFQTATYAFEEGNITVTPQTNDFYVSFFPTEAVNLKFTVDEFDGTKGEKLVANIYYTADTDGEPIVVEMRHSDGSDDEQNFTLTYKSNYEGGPADAPFTWKAVSPYSYTVKTYKNAFDSRDEGLDLTREGYEFTGWNTQADGMGKAYAAGDKYEVSYPDNTAGALYAQWEKSVFDYTLVFEDKEGNVLDSKTVKGGKEETVTLDAYDDAAAAKLPAEKIFDGWARKEANDKVVETVDFDETHATITVVPVYGKYEWLVKFVDEIDGTVYQTTRPSSEEPTLIYPKIFPQTPIKEGYKFLGWKYNGKIVADTPKDKLPVLTKDDLNPIIYATWKKEASSGTITAPGANGSGY